jgi:hypothetical protein
VIGCFPDLKSNIQVSVLSAKHYAPAAGVPHPRPLSGHPPGSCLCRRRRFRGRSRNRWKPSPQGYAFLIYNQIFKLAFWSAGHYVVAKPYLIFLVVGRKSESVRWGAKKATFLAGPSKTCERIENESHGEYQTEHHSDDLRCAPFIHFGRYYPTHPAARR